MNTINNNILKAKLISFAAEEGNLISFRECNIITLNRSDFEIVIVTNNNILHTMRFDYHLKLLSIKSDTENGDLTNMNRISMERVYAIIEKAKSIRQGLGL